MPTPTAFTVELLECLGVDRNPLETGDLVDGEHPAGAVAELVEGHLAGDALERDLAKGVDGCQARRGDVLGVLQGDLQGVDDGVRRVKGVRTVGSRGFLVASLLVIGKKRLAGGQLVGRCADRGGQVTTG